VPERGVVQQVMLTPRDLLENIFEEVALLGFAFLENSIKDKQNQGVCKDFHTFIAD